MKPIWTILITVLVTGGLVGGGTYYYLNDKATKDKNTLQSQINDLNKKVADAEKSLADAEAAATATTTTATDETANWKTYTNDKYGYSIKFPTDFSVVESGIAGTADATANSSAITITNNSLNINIDPNVSSTGESDIQGVTVDKGFNELAQTAGNNYNKQTQGSVQFAKFSYLKKVYSFATLAGYMEGIIENTKESENYGKYSESYHLQTKRGNIFFGIDYNSKIAKADKDSTGFKAGIDEMEKIISTIQYTK